MNLFTYIDGEEFSFWELSDPGAMFGLDDARYEAVNKFSEDYFMICRSANRLIEMNPKYKEKYTEQCKKAIGELELQVKNLLGNKVHFR